MINKSKLNKLGLTILVVVLVVTVFLSIFQITTRAINNQKKDMVIKQPQESNRLGTVEYGDCQYLVWIDGNRAGLTHRGDCDNIRHKENKNE